MAAVNIRERYHEVIELKEAEVRDNTLQKMRFHLRRFVDFLDDRRVTDSKQITMRHVLDYMRRWSYQDSTRILETRRLKFFLHRLHRTDLGIEIKIPRQTAEGMARRKPKPYTDVEIAAFRAVADPDTELFFLTSIQTALAVADLVLLKPEPSPMVASRRDDRRQASCA
jgi:site-specific recombinase XerD